MSGNIDGLDENNAGETEALPSITLVDDEQQDDVASAEDSRAVEAPDSADAEALSGGPETATPDDEDEDDDDDDQDDDEIADTDDEAVVG